MSDEKVKITYPKFTIGDIVTIDPLSSDHVPGTTYIQVSSLIKNDFERAKRNEDSLSEGVLGKWEPKHNRRYKVIDVFANHAGIREDHQYSGIEGYLLLVQALSYGAPSRRFLIPDWVCMKAEEEV